MLSHSTRTLPFFFLRSLRTGVGSQFCFFRRIYLWNSHQNIKRKNLFSASTQINNFRECSSQAGSSTEECAVSEQSEMVNVTFVTPSGEKINVQGKVGQNIMEVAMEHDVGMAGACEGQLACTTCHVYVDEKYQEIIGNAEYEEEDLLDMAPFITPYSRLSCQIALTKELEGAFFYLPSATVNFYVDKQKPSKH